MKYNYFAFGYLHLPFHVLFIERADEDSPLCVNLIYSISITSCSCYKIFGPDLGSPYL